MRKRAAAKAFRFAQRLFYRIAVHNLRTITYLYRSLGKFPVRVYIRQNHFANTVNHNLAINVLENELRDGASFCRNEDLGIEITAFAFSRGLDEGFEERVERHQAAVSDLPWASVHGPFIDLIVNSPDPAIVEVCKQRHQQALGATELFGAKIYVAHLNSNPLIRNEGYRDRFPRAVANFWLPFADRAGKHGITIVLENLWESGPELQKRVVEEANHPHLKASFDNGHALVFSKKSAKEWISVLGKDLIHCHLHDNDGTYDQHRSIGEGIEDWPSLLDALRDEAPNASIILESDYLEANRVSYKRINQNERDRRF